MTHPLAITPNRSGFTNSYGDEINSGDRVVSRLDGRQGVMDEALHDGDAFVTWDDKTFGTVKWNSLARQP
jgi:hypothetical protein